MSCSCALIGIVSRVGRSSSRPAAFSLSMESHETGWPREAQEQLIVELYSK